MLNTLNIFILDDEEGFLRKLQLQVEEFFSKQNIQIRLSACSDQESLLNQLTASTPDLLIADITLGDNKENGIDLAMTVKKQVPACEIIYLTAYLSYATEIYETEPLYFVLKEQMDVQLEKALNFYLQKQKRQQNNIQVYINRELTTINTEDILFCEHERKYTKIVCKDEMYLVRISMKKLMEMLDEGAFSFSHSGFIVNLAQIRSHTRTVITLYGGQEIPIGRSHLESFRTAYARYLGNTL